MQTWSKGHTYLHQPTAGPVPLARAQPFHAGNGSHRHLFRSYWGPKAWQSRCVNERGKPASQKPLTAEESEELSTKHQLHTTYVGAVGWEPHSSSTAKCSGKVDHELPVHWSKGYTYTNPAWPLSHACAQPYHGGSGSHGPPLRPYWGSSARHSSRSETWLDPFLPRRVL